MLLVWITVPSSELVYTLTKVKGSQRSADKWPIVQILPQDSNVHAMKDFLVMEYFVEVFNKVYL